MDSEDEADSVRLFFQNTQKHCDKSCDIRIFADDVTMLRQIWKWAQEYTVGQPTH